MEEGSDLGIGGLGSPQRGHASGSADRLLDMGSGFMDMTTVMGDDDDHEIAPAGKKVCIICGCKDVDENPLADHAELLESMNDLPTMPFSGSCCLFCKAVWWILGYQLEFKPGCDLQLLLPTKENV